MTTNQLQKRFILRKRFEFQQVTRNGQRLVGQLICIDWRFSRLPYRRLGITASKRFGKAHDRNRFKRWVREAFRLSQNELPEGIDINVIPRPYARKADFFAIQSELILSCKKIPINELTCR